MVDSSIMVAGKKSIWLATCWTVLSIAALVPIWSARVLPILDAPIHLALARGWHSMGDPRFAMAAHYAIRLRPVPYLLYYTLVHGGMFVFDIETANKVVLSIYVLAFPVSVAVCARSLGRDPRLGLWGFVFVFNPCWIYGYVSYLLGTVAFLFSVAALFGWLATGGRALLAAFVVASITTYFGHVLTWSLLVASTIALAAAEPWIRRSRAEASAPLVRRLASCAALTPTLIFALATFWDEHRSRAYVARDAGFRGTWRWPWQAVAELPRRALDVFPGWLDTAVFVVALSCTIFLCRRCGVSRARRLLVVLGVVAISWLALPYEVSKPVVFFQISGRLPPLLMVLACLLPAMDRSAPRWPALLVSIAALALFFRFTVLSRDFDRRNRPFFDIVDSLPDGSSTLVVVRHMMQGEHPEEMSGDAATSAPVYWGFAEWPMALHGGYAPYVFDQGVPIVPTTKLEAPPFPPPDDLLPRDAPAFDFYLVREPTAAQRAATCWRVVREVGSWTLFANDCK